MEVIASEIAGTRRPLLTSLQFNGCMLTDEGAMGLFKALERENQVSEVGLAENALKDDFAARLESWLKT